jgi:acetoin utilization deacetylase AcuC-like enzyme
MSPRSTKPATKASVVRLFYTDVFVLPLPAGHRFPMEKYSRLREASSPAASSVEADFHLPHAATDAELGRAHDPAYIHAVSAGLLPEKAQKPSAFRGAPAWSSVPAARPAPPSAPAVPPWKTALRQPGRRHAPCVPRPGRGFCVFNDAAVAARAMQAEGRANRVLIVDCDVHQGNGTASILRGDDSIFTFSIHGARNFPSTRNKAISTSNCRTAARRRLPAAPERRAGYRFRSGTPRSGDLPGRRRPLS